MRELPPERATEEASSTTPATLTGLGRSDSAAGLVGWSRPHWLAGLLNRLVSVRGPTTWAAGAHNE
jgi:hypothetical protein